MYVPWGGAEGLLLLIRIPPYRRLGWGSTNEKTPSPLWFSIPMASNPLETSFPQSSSEALDSRPSRDKGSSYPKQLRQGGLGRTGSLSIPDTAVSGGGGNGAGGSLSARGT